MGRRESGVGVECNQVRFSDGLGLISRERTVRKSFTKLSKG
jgi:hypothetical protein